MKEPLSLPTQDQIVEPSAFPFPSITIIPDNTLLSALWQLDPETFKLFIYLHHRAEKFRGDMHGLPFDSELSDYVHKTIGLDQYTTIAAFMTLREMEWVQAFCAVESDRRDRGKEIHYLWCMQLVTPEGKTNLCNGIQQVENPQDGRYANDTIIAIGTQYLPSPLPPTPQKAKRGRQYSNHFKRIRHKVLERDGHKCTKCEETSSLHVHHLHYENEGHELLEDLVTLCPSCHRKVGQDE